MTFNPNVTQNHWESSWETTSIFGARSRVEVDIKENHTLSIKLISQSAFSRFVEAVSNFIPIDRLIQRISPAFVTRNPIDITSEVIDTKLAAKIGKAAEGIIENAMSGFAEKVSPDLTNKTVSQIKHSLHDYLDSIFKAQAQAEKNRTLRSSILDVDSFTGMILPRKVNTPSRSSEEDSSQEKMTGKDSGRSTATEFDEWTEKESFSELRTSITEEAVPPVVEEKPLAASVTPPPTPAEEEVNIPVRSETEEEQESSSHEDSMEEAPPEPPTLKQVIEEFEERVKPEIVLQDEIPPTPKVQPLQKPSEGEESESSLVLDDEDEEQLSHEQDAEASSHERQAPLVSEPSSSESEIPDAIASDENVPAPAALEEGPDAIEGSLPTPKVSVAEETPKQVEELHYSLESIKRESSVVTVAAEIINRVKRECDKVKQAIEGYEKELQTLQKEHPAATFENVLAKLNKIHTDLEEELKKHTVRWYGMKYPTPVANLTVEQLLEFEIQAKNEVKKILAQLANDPLGIKRFTQAVHAHATQLNAAELLLGQLRADNTGDHGAVAYFTKLINDLSRAKNREKASIDTIIAKANQAGSLVPFIDGIERQRKNFLEEITSGTQGINNGRLLHRIRQLKNQPEEQAKLKQSLIDEVQASVITFNDKMDSLLNSLVSEARITGRMKDAIRDEVGENKKVLDVFVHETYPFVEGWWNIGLIPTNKPLIEASGFQLVQFRREAETALRAAQERLRPFRDALAKEHEAKEFFNNTLKTAREKLTETNNAAAETLRVAISESEPLEKPLAPADRPEQLLDRAQTLGKAVAKLKSAMKQLDKWETLKLEERVGKSDKLLRSGNKESLIASADMLLQSTRKKIETYATLLEDETVTKHVSGNALDAIREEIGKISASEPKAPPSETHKALSSYHKEVKLWALTAVSQVENRCHLFALKESIETYLATAAKAKKWSPGKQGEALTTPQLSRCLEVNQGLVETALKRISGGNSAAQAVQELKKATSSIETTQKLVEMIWVEVREQVVKVDEDLEKAKAEIGNMKEPVLDGRFKQKLISGIEKKIAEAKPYLVGLPRKSWLFWATPFDKMDENSLKVYREDVAALITKLRDELESETLLDKVNPARELFTQTKEMCVKWIESLENSRKFILAADIHYELAGQLKAYEPVAKGIRDVAGLKDYCEVTGEIIGVLTALIEKTRRLLPYEMPSLTEQMRIMEQNWKLEILSLPQYAKIKRLLISEAAEKLDQCIAFAERQETAEWTAEADRLKLMKQKYTPGGVASALKGMFFSQAIPLMMLNSTQMEQYFQMVNDLYAKYIKV